MTNQHHAILPKTRPEGMSVETYYRLARNAQCANLLSGRCSEPCSCVDESGGYPVEFDHIVPRSAGGPSTADNFQLLCPAANRSKYTNPDPHYAEMGWWDRPFDHTKLRPHQLSSAYNLVRKDYRDLFAHPDPLMNRILLLAWMVGAGKSIGVVSLVFAYNEVRNAYYRSARRAKRVLWLVHQRPLAESLCDEFKHELTEYGLVDRAPRVEIVDDAAHWSYEADIIVATQQSLWPAKGRNLTPKMRDEILSRFDVIIIDEAQFAVDNYMNILAAAPQALKVAITATPMQGDGTLLCEVDNGRYKDCFALLSTFGYKEGRDLGIFKEVVSLEEGIKSSVYMPVNGGEADILQNGGTVKHVDTSVDLNAFRPRAVIERAIDAAKRESTAWGYDCHIMVRFDSVALAKSWYENLKDQPGIADMGVSIVSAKKSGPQLGSSKHPWMLVKANGGRVAEGSTRIVFTVDIGQFGINNRYCGVVAWVNPNASKIEVVQRIGRAIRSKESFGKVRLVWNDTNKAFRDTLKESLDYILDMETYLGSFETLSDVENVFPPDAIHPDISRVGQADRMMLSGLLGAHGDLAEAVSEWVKLRGHPPTQNQIDNAKRFVEKIHDDQQSRDSACSVNGLLRMDGEALVKAESPPETYPLSSLIAWVTNGEFNLGDKDAILTKLMDEELPDHDVFVGIVTAQARARDEQFYSAPQFSFPAHVLVAGKKDQCEEHGIESYSRMLASELKQVFGNADDDPFSDGFDYGTCPPKLIHEVAEKKCYLATAVVFGLPNFKRATYQSIEPQLIDALMRPRVKKAVMDMARLLAIDELSAKSDHKILHGMRSIYSEQIERVRDRIGGQS